MEDQSEIVEMRLYGGPNDGEVIQIHKDNLKIKPRIAISSQDKAEVIYALDNDGKLVWLPDPDDPKVQRGYFIFDDDGNLISEEKTQEDASGKLDDLNDEGWKYS
jgi:hypothetical protein